MAKKAKAAKARTTKTAATKIAKATKSAKPARPARYTVGDLPYIGRPAAQAFAAIGITTLRQIARRSEQDLLAVHGVGPKAVRILRDALAEQGLSFASVSPGKHQR